MKKILKILFSKIFIIAALALIQLVLILAMTFSFSEAYIAVNIILVLLKLLFMLKVINSELAPAYKISWITLILMNTVVGVTLYLLFGRVNLRKSALKRMEESKRFLSAEKEKYKTSLADDEISSKIGLYLSSSCSSGTFSANHSEFYSVGEKFFESLFCELQKAKSYIYLEYFIIGSGKIWDRLFEILGERIKAGVDVSLIYDDFGSLFKIDENFLERVQDTGIKFKAFNKISPALSSSQNYRDHRKVCVIDGNTAFIGGINLSDEYANITHPYGHWKDTAVMIKGSVAQIFSNQFISAFSGLLSRGDKIEEREPLNAETFDENGTIAPYFDTPFENRQICRDMYETLISSAKESICITTPYFIPDYGVETAIKNALICGVKVRIIIPGIYDKWYVREVTQMYVSRLEKYGAEIYLYSPGFIHQKMLIVDGKYAVTGSSNLDYRSFYLSFESGLFMYNTPSVSDMLSDFEKTVGVCERLPVKIKNAGIVKSLFRQTLAIFSPLM